MFRATIRYLSLPTSKNNEAALFYEKRAAQVFFAGQLSDEEILAKFQAAADGTRALLERYKQVPQQIEAYANMIDAPRETFFWMLTLEIGIKTAQTQLDWMESVMERIKKKRYSSHPNVEGYKS